MDDLLDILLGLSQQQGLGDFFDDLKQRRKKRMSEYDSLIDAVRDRGGSKSGLSEEAQQKLIGVKKSSNAELSDAIEQASSKYGLPPKAKNYLYAIADIESSFGKNVVGRPTQYGRAEGPFQFIPPTAEQYGLSDPYDPYQSADAAARHLLDSYQQQGDWHRAAIGHHSGPGWSSLGKWGQDYDRKLRERVG